MADSESPIATAEKAKILKLQSFQETDAGNAEAFQLLHGERFRYDHTKGKWLVWNGAYWAEDTDGEADRAALETARQRYLADALLPHGKDKDRSVNWALKSESVSGRRFTLISAQTIKSFATVTQDTWTSGRPRNFCASRPRRCTA
jgi:phage/plasmid-associated DNA primase